MSYRPPQRARRGQPQKMRGPSRPIDPRYSQRKRQKGGMDRFAMTLVAVSVVAAIGVLLIVLLQSRNNQPGTSTPVAGGLSGPPAITATAVAFATLTSPEALPRITVQDAKALYDKNDVSIFDVRDAQFFNQGHIKGAVNIPQAQVKDRLAEIPSTGNVVLYCQ